MSLYNTFEKDGQTLNIFGKVLDMREKQIIHLGEPLDDHHGINRLYVDNQLKIINDKIDALDEKITALLSSLGSVQTKVDTAFI